MATVKSVLKRRKKGSTVLELSSLTGLSTKKVREELNCLPVTVIGTKKTGGVGRPPNLYVL